MNKIIMQKPDDLEIISDYYKLLKGSEIIAKFYYQGIWKECNIPKELRESNFVPNRDKFYRCWWKFIVPADPADPGFSMLKYIEEY